MNGEACWVHIDEMQDWRRRRNSHAKNKRQNSKYAVVEFGEVVLSKLPKVPHMPGDFRDRFEEGVWVGAL